MITAERLRGLLNYSPATGDFVWKDSRQRGFVGKVAGNVSLRGYWCIGLDRKRYTAHRLAWLYVTGEWPPHQIDHINGNRIDNRFANLRCATPSENQANCRRHQDNETGLKGVTFYKPLSKWKAGIKIHGKSFYLGYFNTPEAAHEAYLLAAKRAFGEFARAS